MPVQTCQNEWCRVEFEITAEDEKFYARMGVPHPTLCPDCRQQRRLAFRNERKLYHRKCDLCSKQIISIYSPDKPYQVYCPDCWWSDKWDPTEYGRDFDFNRLFFEQWKELQIITPRLSLFGKNNHNSDFTNHCDGAKNSYICVSVGGSEDIFYGKWVLDSRDCVDCYQIEKCELCYEVLYTVGAYNCSYSFLADNCKDSAFLLNCRSCENCFGCANLHNKKYCFFNEQLTKEAYLEKMRDFNLGSHQIIQRVKKLFFGDFLLKVPHQLVKAINCEDCFGGDFYYNCKNVCNSFDVIDSRDSKFCYDAGYLNDCYDVYESAFACEMQYECHACNRVKFSAFNSVSYDNSDIFYSDICHNSSNLFGCIGLKHAKHCILNKQYTKEKYEELKAKIIANMQKTGEWGEFFPVNLSPFAYNETVAQEYYPLTKEEVLARGWSWRDEEPQAGYIGPKVEIPDNITEVTDDITKQVLTCEITGKNYKIIPQELGFYRRMNLPIPRRCPDQRHLDRLARRNPRKLWDRSCAKCQKEIQTTYSPDRPELVYCEECYLKEVN